MIMKLALPIASVLRRLTYAVLFAASVAGALLVAGPGAWQVWAFVVLPDLALLVGISPGLERGQLHPRAVPLYNGLHRFAGPAGLAAVSLWLGPVWLAGALGWAAHIAVDRAVGYGLRDARGFMRAA
jgi:hypothetical protein